MNDFQTIFIECTIVGVVILTAYALSVIVLVSMEHKVCAYFQYRFGPMRVGFWEVFQVSAGVFRMPIKEIFAVDKTDKFLYCTAPFFIVIASVDIFPLLPRNKGVHIFDFNMDISLVTAISNIGVLDVFLVGWASSNKYSVLSTICRAVQMISYGMTSRLTLTTAVALTGTMQMSGIVEAQTESWNWLIIKGHLPAITAFLLLLVAGNAETDHGSFDLVEVESELTTEYHTEYSGVDFGFYYLVEYLNLFVTTGLAIAVFLGGWVPLSIGVKGSDMVTNCIPGTVWPLDKTFIVVWFLM